MTFNMYTQKLLTCRGTGPPIMVLALQWNEFNRQTQKALLDANGAAVVPKILIVNGILSIVAYRNVARVRKHGQKIDSTEVCIPETLVADAGVLSGLLAASAELLRLNRKGELVPAAVPAAPLNAMLKSGARQSPIASNSPVPA